MIYSIKVQKLPDGRDFIADEVIALAGDAGEAFVRQFSGYYQRDAARQGWVGPSHNQYEGIGPDAIPV